MEALQASGKVKSIGVSNFSILQLERLLSRCNVPPAVNQVATTSCRALGVSKAPSGSLDCNRIYRRLFSFEGARALLPYHSQVELHPYLVQTDMIEFCKSKNIALTAFSPLGSPGRPSEM